MTQPGAAQLADVGLILEGTYPYVAGGVSSWTHDLIRGLPQFSFTIVTLMPPGAALTHRYELPSNVVAVMPVTLQKIKRGKTRVRQQAKLLASLREPIEALLHGGGLAALARVIDIIGPRRDELGQEILLDSRDAWNLLVDMYQGTYAETSFLDYFWSWRALLGGLFSLIVAPLPQARVYHTVSTGYAGLFVARARLETGRPALVTEHGIYTNERRIEIAMADWLFELPMVGFSIDRPALDLKDFWIAAFEGYSRACYEACDEIITLYEGNQAFQIADGAPQEKLAVVPNGIDYPRFSAIGAQRNAAQPTIALIGRVVPIKDIKSYVRAVAKLRELVPAVRALIMGPTEEDAEYYDDCVAMVEHLGLQDTVSFTGRVKLDDYLGHIDVVVLTSISEAQPLVLLEAGAVGIPAVSTDVGSCREILLGRGDEEPALGPAGEIVRLSDPDATARAVARLLSDAEWYAQCSLAIRQRVETYYQERDVMTAYGERYHHYKQLPTRSSSSHRERVV